jgi:hypothetical protein
MRHAGGWHLRFQKRIQLMKGVRLNVGRRGVGVTVGGRLARLSMTARGQLYQSASIPGTGISMRRTLGSVRQLSQVSPSRRPRLITPVMIGLAVFGLMLLLAALR